MSSRIVVPTTTRAKGRPIVKMAIKDPKGVYTPYIEFNMDTGASYPTDIPLNEGGSSTSPTIASRWGSTNNSSQKYFDTTVKLEGLDGEYKIQVCLQDNDHYDLFKDERPPTRYPLCRVRDLAKYISFVWSKENTAIAIGATQPQELRDAVAAKKVIPRLADMSKRSGTPTTNGWQWYKGNIQNPSTFQTSSDDWLGCNTGDRHAIIKKSFADKVKLSYPKLTSSNNYRAETKATLIWKESSPPINMSNVTIEVRDDKESFARGGTPRNLIGGPPFLDRYSIVLWSSSLHLAFIPR